jgi:hypothetical protein
MSIYALVKNNLVINTIEWDGRANFDPGPGVVVHPIDKLPQGVSFPQAVASDEISDLDKLQADIAAIKDKLGA